MKRVLHLIKGLGRGGAELLLVSASPYFDRERFHYEVAYLLPWKDAVVEGLRSTGIPVHCLDGGRGTGWLRRLRSLVREQEIDLVHSHSPFAAVGARTVLGRAVKHVHTEHNVWTSYHRATYWGNLLTFPVTSMSSLFPSTSGCRSATLRRFGSYGCRPARRSTTGWTRWPSPLGRRRNSC